MNWYKIFVDIINPIICALLGGGLTLIGVWLTINNESKKEAEKTKLSMKPLFYRIDPHQEYDANKAINYIFKSDNYEKKEMVVFGIIKNTDHAIAILDFFVINNVKYYPSNGNVIDKNTIVNLNIYLENEVPSKDIYMYIKDAMNNEYCYKLEFSQDISSKVRWIKSYTEVL